MSDVDLAEFAEKYKDLEQVFRLNESTPRDKVANQALDYIFWSFELKLMNDNQCYEPSARHSYALTQLNLVNDKYDRMPYYVKSMVRANILSFNSELDHIKSKLSEIEYKQQALYEAHLSNYDECSMLSSYGFNKDIDPSTWLGNQPSFDEKWTSLIECNTVSKEYVKLPIDFSIESYNYFNYLYISYPDGYGALLNKYASKGYVYDKYLLFYIVEKSTD